MRRPGRARAVVVVLLVAVLAVAGPAYAAPSVAESMSPRSPSAAGGPGPADATAQPQGNDTAATAQSSADRVPTAAQSAAGAASADGGSAVTGTRGGTPPRTDSTVTRIQVFANRTAVWTVEIRTRLRTNESVSEYEAFQTQFRANTSRYLDSFRRSMTGVVASAANETGRTMHARDFEASTRIQRVPRRWGVVTYEFTWHHFAVQDGRAIVVGDAFGSGFYLTENDTLTIVAPDEYVIAQRAPPSDDGSQRRARWFGPRSFATGRPHVRFEPRLPTTTADAGSGTSRPTGTAETTADGTVRLGGNRTASSGDGSAGRDGTASTAGPSDSAGGGIPWIALVAIPLVVVGFGAYRYYGGTVPGKPGGPTGGAGGSADASPPADAPSQGGDGTTATTQSGGTADTTANGRVDAAAHGEETDDRGTDAAPAGGDTGDDTGDEGGVSPDPVLTDRERVTRFLEDHGGQVRQSDVVEGLGWSKSKTSRVLSDMAEDEEVEKLRIGRENIISLPEAVDDEGSGDE